MVVNRIVILGLVCFINVGAAAPSVFRASEPVGPDETVLVTGAGFEQVDSIVVQRISDIGDSDSETTPVRVDPIQPSSTSVKFTIPTDLGDGVYRYTISTPNGAVSALLNAPAVFWIQGDRGSCATPGGILRAIGRNIARNGEATLSLLKGDGAVVVRLRPIHYSKWDASFVPPASLGAGEYKLRLQNGQGGSYGAVVAGAFEICKSSLPPAVVLDVKTFGARGDGLADDTSAFGHAIVEAGKRGGEVRVPRGRYRLSAALHIPPGVVLRGERRDLASLMWKDFDDPPPALIDGEGDFGLEDLTLYASNHRHIIEGGCAPREADRGRVRLRRLTIRATAYRGHIRSDDAFRTQQAMEKATGTGADTLRLCGVNIEVTDSNLYGSARAFEFVNPRYAYIARNSFFNGRAGWYAFTGANGVIFENNVVAGVDETASGGGIFANGASPVSSNIVFYANRFERMYGWDREAITTDGPGGFYYGAVRAVDDRTIALASGSDANPTPGSNSFAGSPWSGASVYVLAGRGAGQYATVRARDRGNVTLNSALQVAPDETSIVTIVPTQSHQLYIENRFSDAGIGAQLYGTAFESYFVGNVSERSGGFVSWALWYHHVQPSWGVQFLGNRILDGNVYRGGSNSATDAGDSVVGGFVAPSPLTRTSLMRGVVVRGNHLEGNAHIEVNGNSTDFPSVKDAIVESNRIEHSDVGVVVQGLLDGFYSRRNIFIDVQHQEIKR